MKEQKKSSWGAAMVSFFKEYLFNFSGPGHLYYDENLTNEGKRKKNYIWRVLLLVTAVGLCSILNGQDATYENLYTSFVEYCNRIDGQIHLVGLPLGGIIAMNYALDFPEKVKTLVIIGTPHKIPKVAFEIQNVIFQFFPKSVFKEIAFDKKDTFALGNSIKKLEIIR